MGGSGRKLPTALPSQWSPCSSILDSKLKQCQRPSQSSRTFLFRFEVIWEVVIILRSDWTVSSDSLSSFCLFVWCSTPWQDPLHTPVPPPPTPWDEAGIRLASEEWKHSSSGHHPSAAKQNKHRFSAARLMVKIGKRCWPRVDWGIKLSVYRCSAKHNS